MTAPERIWLQDGGDFDAASEVTWCQHSIDDADTEYIRADLTQPAQGDYHEGLEEGIKIGRAEPQPISKSADLPDPRDEVIARLVKALEVTRETAHSMAHSEFDGVWDQSDFDSYTPEADAALVAAKAVQK